MKITIANTDKKATSEDKEHSVFRICHESNIGIDSNCSGTGSCGKCLIKIPRGLDELSPPTYQEIKLLGNVFHITKERLSCQCFFKEISGEIEIDLSDHIAVTARPDMWADEKQKTKTVKKENIEQRKQDARDKRGPKPDKKNTGGFDLPKSKIIRNPSK